MPRRRVLFPATPLPFRGRIRGSLRFEEHVVQGDSL